MTLTEAVAKIEERGKKGYLVSVLYGQTGDKSLRWTITVIHPDQSSFDDPVMATNFPSCVQLMEVECWKKGWI